MDFSHRSAPPTPWEAPSPGSYAMSNARGAPGTPYGGAPIYRESPARHQAPLATSLSSNDSFAYVPPFPGDDSSHQNVNRTESTASNLQPKSPPPPPRGTLRSKHTNSTSTEDTDGDGQTQKKKKRRVALSCAECAKRKQRCNRETPCQHCVARRVPELCVPYTRPSSPPEKKGSGTKKDSTKVKTENEATTEKVRPSMLPTISVRVARLEAIVNAVVNRIPEVGGTKALKDWRINHAPATSPPPLGADDDDDEESVRPQTSGDRELDRPGSTSSTRSRQDDHSAEWGGEDEGEGDGGVGGLDRATSSRNPLPQSMMHPSQPVSRGLDHHGTPAESLQRLFEHSGVSPLKVSELLKDLPERALADKLVDWFFEKFNFVRYPIDDHAFKRAFETVYADGNNSSAVLALPLVFIVLAISARIAPEAVIDTEEKKRALSLHMYWSSKSAAVIAAAVKAENIQLVETRICSGLYLVLMHERRLAEGWSEFRSALTTGQAIGLHRDGKKLGLDPYVTEYRRRLWSYLVHADATYSCLLGRPTSIDSACVDTLPPSNLDLLDLLEDKLAKPKPMTEPTFGTYLLLRRRLGDIVAKITHHFQRLTGQTQYRDVEALDAELKQFVADLPPTFTMLNHDKSYDSKLWFLPIHRYYIQTEILHFTIILHVSYKKTCPLIKTLIVAMQRPWLLRRLKSSRYNLSRTACFDAAITDYKIRQAFKIDCPDFFETLLGSSFREFRAAHSNDMRMIVQSFMEQHPHDPKADDFSQKEAAIIYTLHRRAQEMEERRQRRYGPRRSADNLSFQRSSPRNTGTRSAMHSPPQPTLESSEKQATSEPSRSAPLLSPCGSAPSYFKGTPYGQGLGPTPPGVSPEEDHPQRLLDHWLMSNTSFGPGADSTMNQFNIGFFSGPVPTMVSESGSGSAGHTGPQVSPHQYPSVGYQQGHPPHPIQVPEQMPWMDPSLVPTTPVPALQAPAVISGMSGGIMGGDGNNMQYWNALIDGIVGGLPNYDPSFSTVG
ncbi:nuclear protein [Cryptococcus gattii Ru294]|nr:nuclear protein [Cryptococcus gattii Ru294]